MTTVSLNTNLCYSSSYVEDGFLERVQLVSGTYRVYAYLQNDDGSRTYLPSTIDPTTLSKIKTLTSSLLKAHESRQTTYTDSHRLTSAGLLLQDSSFQNHDFEVISPIQELTQLIPSSPLKAQDIWNSLENEFSNATQKALVPTPALTAFSAPVIPSGQEGLHIDLKRDTTVSTPLTLSAPLQPSSIPLAPLQLNINRDRIPFVSYIDTAFKGVEWDKLPSKVQKDAVRHVLRFPGDQGQAEDQIRTQCEYLISKLENTRNELTGKCNQIPFENGLETEGEQILDLFYLNAKIENFFEARDRLKKLIDKLPAVKQQIFYHHVLSLAKAANVQIVGDGETFAQTHGFAIPFTSHTIQALEQLLHT